MSDSLGLSVGMTNLVAARDGRPPVTRRSVLTLFSDRAPEVGVPSENPNLGQPGLVLGGFVDRVGDPVPLVASDGSSHRGDQVLAEALDAMAHTVGGGNPITIALPAHWAPAVVAALQTALRNKPSLATAAVVPDSVAALAGLRASLPAQGVVALVDLGGTGTSVTLADAGAQLALIGATLRYADFSGEQIDQALLNHVIAGIADAGDADPAGTAAVGSLGRLRDECRRAKERLSADTATVIPAELPGYSSDVRVTRAELDQLIDPPLGGLLAAIEELLQRSGIAPGRLSAVAMVGGGAAIPLVTQRLSERLQVPVVTAPQSATLAAAGASLVADLASEAGAATGLAPAASPDSAPTGMAPTMGWAGAAAGAGAAAAGAEAPGGLAWSQDDDAPTGEPVPYQGPDYETGYAASPTDARPPIAFAPGEDDYPAEPEPLPWYKRPPLLFGAAAAAALLAVGGLAVTLTGTSSPSGPVTETATSFSTEPGQPGVPVVTEPQTVTVTGDDGVVTTSEVPPPPPPTTTATTTTTPSTTS
ncbi:Hsp70 family protein, partial [Mycolicibacterium frederiksbergense]|uniref:Hsp70 family protein n=1 Tax=Mycolicibacterium frederiksbergense TaxID=117567 RepID=UPI0039EF99F3